MGTCAREACRRGAPRALLLARQGAAVAWHSRLRVQLHRHGCRGRRRGAVLLQRAPQIVDALQQRQELPFAQLLRGARVSTARKPKAAALASLEPRLDGGGGGGALLLQRANVLLDGCDGCERVCAARVGQALPSQYLAGSRACGRASRGLQASASRRAAPSARGAARASYSSLCLRSVRALSSSTFRPSISASACARSVAVSGRHFEGRRNGALARLARLRLQPCEQRRVVVLLALVCAADRVCARQLRAARRENAQAARAAGTAGRLLTRAWNSKSASSRRNCACSVCISAADPLLAAPHSAMNLRGGRRLQRGHARLAPHRGRTAWSASSAAGRR
jgi:hypothetical protein